MKRKLSPEEKAEVAARKRHKSINQQIRGARGVTVEVPIGTPKSSVKMGEFIRASTGRSNGRDTPKAVMNRRISAVAKGIILSKDGTEILHDIRSDEEKAEEG